jgi:hypothetical protein
LRDDLCWKFNTIRIGIPRELLHRMYYISSADVGVAVAMHKAFNHESASNTNFNRISKKNYSRLTMRLLAITLIQSQKRHSSNEIITKELEPLAVQISILFS